MKRATGLFLLLASVPACVSSSQEMSSRAVAAGPGVIPGASAPAWSVPDRTASQADVSARRAASQPIILEAMKKPQTDDMALDDESRWRHTTPALTALATEPAPGTSQPVTVPPVVKLDPPPPTPTPVKDDASSQALMLVKADQLPATPVEVPSATAELPKVDSSSAAAQSLLPMVVTPPKAVKPEEKTAPDTGAVEKTAPMNLNLEEIKATPLPTPLPTGVQKISLMPSEKATTASEAKLDPVMPGPEKALNLSVPSPSPESSTRGPMGAPIVRLVNSKKITVNFEIKDAGPSGVASVDLWFTRDCKEWRKHDGPAQGNAYVVQVPDEGMYGFTLVAHSGVGIAKEPPMPGDLPQVWVVVDLSKPVVQLYDLIPSPAGKDRALIVRWKATDPNLGRQPITLSYAEKENGPWLPMAANLDNTGSYVWHLPAATPAQVLVKVEATDLAGNIGQAVSTRPILLDTATPTVSILTIEPGK